MWGGCVMCGVGVSCVGWVCHVWGGCVMCVGWVCHVWGECVICMLLILVNRQVYLQQIYCFELW